LFGTDLSDDVGTAPRIETSLLDQAYAFYYNSRVLAERRIIDTHSLERLTTPQIAAFGPNPVVHNRPFNQQPNGASAIWVEISSAPSFGDTLVLDNVRLRTSQNRNVLTAEVPAKLYDTPATLPLLVEYHRGGRRHRSDPVDFRVE
jgi:hypothetical protein